MIPGVFHGLTGAVCLVGLVACGGPSTAERSISHQEASLAALEQGATMTRAYLGTTQDVVVGARPVVGTFDLLGGADVNLELVAKDGAPLQVELWQVHVGAKVAPWATLEHVVDAPSGFSLHPLHADEDSAWVLRWPAGSPGEVVVNIACVDSTHGCTPFQQPGQRCPAGWACDQGLRCQVPGDVCVEE